ncbi:MAG: chemotaxis protein CheW [Pseudomonadota bacterium]
MDDLLREFVTETAESLSELDGQIVKLEQNPNDQDLLSNIFRLVHTIKGTCGFLGLPRLESVAHAGENVLGKVRDGELEVTPQAVTLILQCLDRIRELLDALEETEAEPEGNDQELIDQLNAFAEGGGATEMPSAEAPVEMASAEMSAIAAEQGETMATSAEGVIEEAPEVTMDELELAFLNAKGPEELAAEAAAMEAASGVVTGSTPPVDQPLETQVPETQVPETKPESQSEPQVAAAPAKPKPAASAGGDNKKVKKDSVANQSIRVNVDVLEDLMTMASELVLTRNQLLQILRDQKESEFAAPLQRLNYVVSELQEGVMATRMQPIGNAWAKLPRIIRDLSHELGKSIELVMQGAETELDRQVLELIKDPLTHMVRNSADHGLEMPADRVAAGKDEGGTITLAAYHEGGHIIIQISDDGRGLNIDAIKAKSVANGLATEADFASLSEQQIQQFIFKPGFSTATEVTAVSGRGVGMDVVRTNIEKIGGTIELSSQQGQGTQVTIKIPLTLAIVSALIVEAGAERFAIPQLSVVELVRASSRTEHTVERINGTPVLRLRNRLLPLVNLAELMELKSPNGADTPLEGSGEEEHHALSGEDGDDKELFVVVAQIGAYSMGIIVDRVFDTEEIVVKPVAPILRNLQLFSGNTILGDGSVVMILDPNGIAAATGEINMANDLTNKKDEAANQMVSHGKVSMLVFRAVDETPKAVPLELIARLEEIDLSTVENSNGSYVVQYRGQLMPLICMDPEKQLGDSGLQSVLVFSDQDRSMGLVVEEVIDIVEDHLAVEIGSACEGYLGTAVVDGKATDIVDTGYFLNQAFSDWFDRVGASSGEPGGRTRLLLVDDSHFFRNMLRPLLSVAGYDVVTAESADQALRLCNAGESFDIIVSDIEMPDTNGFEFAQQIKNQRRWANTPIVALSAFTSPADLQKGRDVGFDDYVAKNDREALLAALRETLGEQRGAA